MLKCAGNEDIITIKAEDQPDNVQFLFETPGLGPKALESAIRNLDYVCLLIAAMACSIMYLCIVFADQDRMSDFELKLIQIDSENMGIPDMEHSATVIMPSSEFQRIMRDLSTIGDTGKACML